jgi:hypothetical protein
VKTSLYPGTDPFTITSNGVVEVEVEVEVDVDVELDVLVDVLVELVVAGVRTRSNEYDGSVVGMPSSVPGSE